VIFGHAKLICFSRLKRMQWWIIDSYWPGYDQMPRDFRHVECVPVPICACRH